MSTRSSVQARCAPSRRPRTKQTSLRPRLGGWRVERSAGSWSLRPSERRHARDGTNNFYNHQYILTANGAR